TLLSAPGTSQGRPARVASSAWVATSVAVIQAGPGIGRPSMPARSANSVRVKPGSTVVRVTPVPASSPDTASPKLATNALLAPYVALPGVACSPATDETLSTAPRPRETIAPSAAYVR